MFDIGGSELLVIGVVALIVVGPKDLPKMFHALGQFTAKARQMAREFQRAMENAADEAGVGDVASDLKSLNSLRNIGTDTLKSATKRLESWDENKRASTEGLQPDPDAPLPEAKPEGSAESGDWAAASEPGPATKELAEKRKAQATARAEAAASAKEPAKKPAAKTSGAKSAASKPAASKAAGTKTAAKTTRAKSTAAKATAKTATAKLAAAKPAAKSAAKSAAKPKATRTAAKAAKPPKEGDA